MDKLCAIIDAQGFIVNGKFYIRELAFTKMNSSTVHCWNVEIPINFEKLINKDKITNDYIRRNISGLPFNISSDVSNYIKYEKLNAFIGYLYNKSCSLDCKYFGIKNPQLAEMFIGLDIPFISLDDDIPTVRKLHKFYRMTVFCPKHTENIRGTCSAQKVDHIKKWITDTLQFDKEILL